MPAKVPRIVEPLTKVAMFFLTDRSILEGNVLLLRVTNSIMMIESECLVSLCFIHPDISPLALKDYGRNGSMNAAVRRNLYANHGVKMLLRQMLNQGLELIPEYDQNLGFRYPEAERFLSGPVTETLYIIRQLYEAAVLLKKYRDKAVACPSCLSPAVSVKYLCVSCSSSNIEKRRIVQHVVCGFSDVEESFVRGGDYFCPKCRTALTKAGLRESAVNFRCRECGESFEQPTWMHECRKCKFNFTLNEASFIDVFSYVLSMDVRSELEGPATSIAPFRNQLEELGFEIPALSSLMGKSGTVQTFDLVARRRVEGKEHVVVLDLVYSTEPLDVSAVSSLMGKVIDTDPNITILVAIPGMTQDGKNLAELYDIIVIEGENARDAAAIFERRLASVLRVVR